MSQELVEKAALGLDAWRRGDVSVLEELLDPGVKLLAVEAGPWDCLDRRDVLALLRDREEGPTGRDVVELVDCGDAVVAVMAADEDLGRPGPATLVRFRAGRVIHMQQYRSREDAIAAATT
ncbi:MAG: hypothetical protein ACXVY3_07520 [Gaiellaceae bacterium]